MEMHCPHCSSEHPYEDGGLWVCPECGHEWSANAPVDQAEDEAQAVVKDANGTVLADGDSVTVITPQNQGGIAGYQGRHQGARHSSGGWRRWP